MERGGEGGGRERRGWRGRESGKGRGGREGGREREKGEGCCLICSDLFVRKSQSLIPSVGAAVRNRSYAQVGRMAALEPCSEWCVSVSNRVCVFI